MAHAYRIMRLYGAAAVCGWGGCHIMEAVDRVVLQTTNMAHAYRIMRLYGAVTACGWGGCHVMEAVDRVVLYISCV